MTVMMFCDGLVGALRACPLRWCSKVKHHRASASEESIQTEIINVVKPLKGKNEATAVQTLQRCHQIFLPQGLQLFDCEHSTGHLSEVEWR